MHVKKYIAIILILVLLFTLAGCKDKFSGSLSIPDKINIYSDGKQKQISKNGDKFDRTLFNRINELVDIKIPKDLSTLKCIISDNDLKEVKGFAVEFIYSRPQSVTINYGKKEKIEFTEIVFPLTEKWQNAAFIKKKDSTYVPVGLRENLDYLVKAAIK
jgi:predicted small lipoprotein YifL